MRHYSKTEWGQKLCEVRHKVPDKSQPNFPKQEFDTLEEGLSFLGSNYSQVMKYHRTGKEYYLKSMSLYLEEIDGIDLTLEILSENKEEIDLLFSILKITKILPCSIPQHMKQQLLPSGMA